MEQESWDYVNYSSEISEPEKTCEDWIKRIDYEDICNE